MAHHFAHLLRSSTSLTPLTPLTPPTHPVLASMHHSNICSYVESFLNAPKNDILYIVMDYADGGDLSGAISRRKKARRPFTESEVMNMFVQICLALKHVHSRKILHRDLKSQNIFLTKKGVVKLGDFGIAKVLDNTGDVARTQIGTPYYLSPEICEDKPYGKKSDVWSLGCVLYEIAALDLPFQARNLPALAHRIMTKEPKALPSSFSAQLRLLASSLLNKKPAIRPSVVAILRSDYVQGHISSLLSHTIKQGTGGMEGDAKPSSADGDNNVGGARGAANADLPPCNFNPKLPPSKIKKQAEEYRRQVKGEQRQQEQRKRSALGNEQNAIRARAAEQYRRNQNQAAAEKANKERIRMEKMEEFRAEQVSPKGKGTCKMQTSKGKGQRAGTVSLGGGLRSLGCEVACHSGSNASQRFQCLLAVPMFEPPYVLNTPFVPNAP